jgi:hypothetical protein
VEVDELNDSAGGLGRPEPADAFRTDEPHRRLKLGMTGCTSSPLALRMRMRAAVSDDLRDGIEEGAG